MPARVTAGLEWQRTPGPVLEPIASKDPIQRVAARWLSIYITTARSQKNVGMAEQRVRDFLVPFMGESPLDSLRADDLRAYRLWLQSRGLAPRSVRHLLTDVRCMLTWAVDTEVLPRSPFPRRIMPRIEETAPDRLADDEVTALLTIPSHQGFVIRLGVSTGMRWGEMCRATRDDLEGGMLTIARTKSGKVRRVPVHQALAREILACEGRLAPYSEGASGSFNKYARRVSGIRKFHVHQLRHTFACRWLERGGSLPALQQILGHASVVTTQHYAKLSDDIVRREAARITGSDPYDWRPPATA